MERYTTKYVSRKYRKSRSAVPINGSAIRGDGLDAGKYFRCAQCGFVCNKERDSLGGPESKNNVSFEIFNNDTPEDGLNFAILGMTHICLRIGADSNPQQIYRNYMPVINSGCPMCGSLNWRGDY